MNTNTNEREKALASERHDVTFEDGGLEAEHLGVHVERGERSAGDDDTREAFEDAGDGEGGVKADEVEDRVRHSRVLRLERLEDESKACQINVRAVGSHLECANYLCRM